MDKWQMQLSFFGKPGVSAAVRILQVSKQLRQYPGLGYATAFASVGLASAIQWLAADQYSGSPFLTIYPAVIVTTLVGGTGAGFVAAALAGASQWVFFIPTFRWVAFLSYAFDATVCVMLIDFINRTLDVLLVNIDEEKQAKQHQYLLAKELHHRIQNLFTVIQAVIRFSLPGEGMVQESAVKQRLTDRLQSMSATNRAITDSMGDGVRLDDLISSEIRGFESQFEIRGASGLVLGPQMTQNLSLLLHELLTNALKHGALSVPQGRVSLRLDWTSWVLTLHLAGTRRACGVAADGLRLRQPHPRSFCPKLLPERRHLLCPGRSALHAANPFRSEPVRRADAGDIRGGALHRLGSREYRRSSRGPLVARP
jgi:HWE histidine kinase